MLTAGLALLLLGGAAALLMESLSPVTAPDCAAIDNADLRLKCYDRVAHRPASPPARGALAPKAD
ncbi:hypothetical protein [Hyphomicrobium sp. CS1GBMeth3]|uniref:hypothetical protein n=1 Tax=Hyphomicrobium sp. CS1GBMeth3 TaxID=1892845 RepID=UPI0009300DDF|nr:hypothetical protein [Hyphomicrobium sp. CS1GBMeth3]